MNISKIEVLHREPQQQQRPTSSTMASSSSSSSSSNKASAAAAAAVAAETAKPLTTKEKEILFQIPGNLKCCDCGQSKPEWASLTLGTVICLDCSGQHRGLGTHISFVRSIVMDSWTPKQLQRMKLGGNMSCQEFMKSRKHQMETNGNENYDNLTIRQKYDTQVGDLYSMVLTAKLEGNTPIPTELPPKRIPKIKPSGKQMSGFGSTAHPREIRKQKRKKIAIVGSAIVSVAAVAWGLSSRGGGGGRGGKASTTNATTNPSATARP